MYTEHFHLKKLPFENVPDPEFFFDRDDYARARKRLTESLKAGRGLLLVTGPIGSGKTTLSQMIKYDFSHYMKIIWMAEPPVSSTDLFLFIAQELGLSPSSSERTFIIRDVRNSLLEIHSQGRKCLVIMDESHLVSSDVINGIRLLNNLEEGSAKLIQILLLGQNELMDKISTPEMEPFKQRIAALEILGKMNPVRIREYISHRIHVAEGAPSIFADSGWDAIELAFRPGGTPRIINSLCDRSLNVAFERGKAIVDAHDVYEAAQGLGLGKEIFHYILELKSREKKVQPSLESETESPPEPKEEIPIPIPVLSKEEKRDKAEPKNELNEIQPAEIVSEKSPPFSEISREGLRVPILLLLLSFITLIWSIVFYCQKAGSEPLSCIHELIGF